MMLLTASHIITIGSFASITAITAAITGSIYGHIHETDVCWRPSCIRKASPTPPVLYASSFQM